MVLVSSDSPLLKSSDGLRQGMDVDTSQGSTIWDKDNVLRLLRLQTATDGRVAAQIFLKDLGDGSEPLTETASRLVRQAETAASDKSVSSIGRVSALAKSFSLTATPEVFSALAANSQVKTILPSAIDDVYPKPVRILPE